MPKNVSVPHTTIDGIVIARGLDGADVGLVRFEINEGETLTIPAGHSVEVGGPQHWQRIYCPDEVTVKGPLRYTTPKPDEYYPAPPVLIDQEIKFGICAGAGALFYIASLPVTNPSHDSYEAWAGIMTICALLGSGVLVGYAFTGVANIFYRKNNPTPTPEQMVETISVAFQEAAVAR